MSKALSNEMNIVKTLKLKQKMQIIRTEKIKENRKVKDTTFKTQFHNQEAKVYSNKNTGLQSYLKKNSN